MSDPLTHLAAALDAAQRDAEAAGGDAWHLDDIVIRDMVDGKATEVDRAPDGVVVGADGRGVIAVQHLGRAAAHIARHDPASTLRRIAAERKTLAACKEILAVDGWEYDDAPNLANDTICNMAEGWGWTEETT